MYFLEQLILFLDYSLIPILVVIIISFVIFVKFGAIHVFLVKSKILSSRYNNKSNDIRNIVFGIMLFLLMIGQTIPDRKLTNGCDLPDSESIIYLYLTSDGSVLYKSPYDIAAFQFNVEGDLTANSRSGGDAGVAGIVIKTAGRIGAHNGCRVCGSRSMVMAGPINQRGSGHLLAYPFTGATIPAGCGTLVNLSLTGDATGLTYIKVYGPDGQMIDETFIEGADKALFPYFIILIYLIISASAQAGSFEHTTKDGSRDKRFKNNPFEKTSSQSTQDLMIEIGRISIIVFIIFLIIDTFIL